MLALGAVVLEGARAGEEDLGLVLVERDGHDAVRGEESLLDAVAVVDVYVDVQHPRVAPEELYDADDDVVDVAEPGRLVLLGVVQAAAPGDGDVGLFVADLARGIQGPAGRHGTVVVEPVEQRAVATAQVELDLGGLLGIVYIPRSVLGGCRREIVQVLGRVEHVQLLVRRRPGDVVVHGEGHAVGRDQALGQGEAPRLHGMRLAEVVLLHLRVGVERDVVSLGLDDVVLLGHPFHLGKVRRVVRGIGLAQGNVVLLHYWFVDLHIVRQIVWFWCLVSESFDVHACYRDTATVPSLRSLVFLNTLHSDFGSTAVQRVVVVLFFRGEGI